MYKKFILNFMEENKICDFKRQNVLDFRSEEFIRWRFLQDNLEMREKIQIILISLVMGCYLFEVFNFYFYVVQIDDDVLLVVVVGQGRFFLDVGVGVYLVLGQFVQEVVFIDYFQVLFVRDVYLVGVLFILGKVYFCYVKQCLFYLLL